MEPVVLRGEVPKSGDGDGYGYGDGDGYGYGDGYGSGYGDGYGDGYGAGYGSGSGYGAGYGSGSGYGDGYGAGYGYGYGDGYGSGSGYGDGAYWLACIKYWSQKWPAAQQARLAAVERSGAKIAFWCSNASGLPANGGQIIEGAAPGVVHTARGPLQLCSRNTLHATLIPPKWRGDRWWVVALIGDVVGDDEKYGALKREIIGECL